MDISKSDIDSLEERVRKLSYKKYLPKLTMLNVRSFENQSISFEFPVTAIIGTNGGGKSTVLGAAAIAYKSVKPGDFFPKSNVGDTSMSKWKIDYEIVDRDINNGSIITRNARFTSAKWRRDNAPDRDVVVIPIQRTVPANEQTRFKQFIGIFQRSDINISKIDKNISLLVSRILGRDASKYVRISLKEDKNRYILSGVRKENDYSQFHFGAGEASIIEMVTKIEESSENSLILIEEIENGLHPLATKKMVEYLFDVAKRKKAQIIFTTHSEYALDVLPPRAIWACIDGNAYQGKLTIDSLRALTGNISKDMAIFVEDDFAKDLCSEIVRQYIPTIVDRVEIHKAGGFPYVVDVLKHHQSNPAVTKKAVAIIDGDNPPYKEKIESVFCLPPGAPEAIVFGYAVKNANEISSLIQQRCQCPFINQDRIVEALNSVSLDTTDHHLYFRKFGDRIGFISEIVVRRGLCSIYVEQNKAILSELIGNLRSTFSV